MPSPNGELLWESHQVPQMLTLLPYDAPLLQVKADSVSFPLSETDSELIANMLYSVEDAQLAAAQAPWPSAAGMAAPQWGASRRIFVIERQYLQTDRHSDTSEARFPGSSGFIVVINPEYAGIVHKEAEEEDHTVHVNGVGEDTDNNSLVESTDCLNGEVEDLDNESTEPREESDWESCFSVPGKRGSVRRYHSVLAGFVSMDGNKHELVLHGWAARVFQHETDHTEGRLYDDAGAARCSRLLDSTNFEKQESEFFV